MKSIILCVDDERIIIMSLIEQLWERFGDKYIYEMAMSGEEALEIIDDLAHEGIMLILIISDWIMGGMKGDELVLRVHEKYPMVRTVILSGQADPGAITNARANGSLDAYVAKPWDKESLMQTITDLINRNTPNGGQTALT